MSRLQSKVAICAMSKQEIDIILVKIETDLIFWCLPLVFRFSSVARE